MNVVFPPALASLFPAAAADALCFEGPCLLGWAWTLLALTFASAWVVRRWQSGDDVARRLLSAGAPAAAFVPQPAFVVPRARTSPARSIATGLADAGLALRAPPTTDPAAVPPEPVRTAGPSSSPSHRPSPLPGTPTTTSEPARAGRPSGQPPPA